METLGDLTDRISIANIRYLKLKEENHSQEKIDMVAKQINALSVAITEHLYMAKNGNIELEAPKVKIYHHEEASGATASSLGEAMMQLTEANLKLWNLEDFRRDKTNSDEERLKACDEVSVWNRKRNDCMDLINNILTTTLENKDI